MTDYQYRVLTINPGGASTKASVYEDKTCVWSANIAHTHEELDAFDTIADQGPFRKNKIIEKLAEDGQDAENFDAVVGVGGVGLAGVVYGTYSVNDKMIEDATAGTYGMHPNNLGVIIARQIADACGAKAYASGMASADEYQQISRVGGFKDTPRRCCVHMLNTKEIALRYAAQQGKPYNEMNLIMCHIGSGISVAAHRAGFVVDGTDGIAQEGPMTVNRPGTVAIMNMLNKIVYVDGATPASVKKRVMSHGGLLDHLGTTDVLKVKKMIADGDEYAALVYDAMLYQIAKSIGEMAVVLKNDIDAIVLTGALVQDSYVGESIEEMVGWIAPVVQLPGDFEQEALGFAALRALGGKTLVLEYTGEPVWTDFDDLARANA